MSTGNIADYNLRRVVIMPNATPESTGLAAKESMDAPWLMYAAPPRLTSWFRRQRSNPDEGSSNKPKPSPSRSPALASTGVAVGEKALGSRSALPRGPTGAQRSTTQCRHPGGSLRARRNRMRSHRTCTPQRKTLSRPAPGIRLCRMGANGELFNRQRAQSGNW